VSVSMGPGWTELHLTVKRENCDVLDDFICVVGVVIPNTISGFRLLSG